LGPSKKKRGKTSGQERRKGKGDREPTARGGGGGKNQKKVWGEVGSFVSPSSQKGEKRTKERVLQTETTGWGPLKKNSKG